jgi:hypothetical protein
LSIFPLQRDFVTVVVVRAITERALRDGELASTQAYKPSLDGDEHDGPNGGEEVCLAVAIGLRG